MPASVITSTRPNARSRVVRMAFENGSLTGYTGEYVFTSTIFISFVRFDRDLERVSHRVLQPVKRLDGRTGGRTAPSAPPWLSRLIRAAFSRRPYTAAHDPHPAS